ncbi:hypothetical protein BJ508DRAFT_418917 [Ascobolus immersus RN42]|uniref:CFEM domain-containing protein n=1 Tax=Ascobolus immersus RN42 TaxID=1160509 RepID=A0A3N4HIK7_ASCIM|nr:hypothetical protein BJ508DRAFT_418917 [Ascobolus immersus RN42]
MQLLYLRILFHLYLFVASAYTQGSKIPDIDSLNSLIEEVPGCARPCAEEFAAEFWKAGGCKSASDWTCICHDYIPLLVVENQQMSTERGMVFSKLVTCQLLNCDKMGEFDFQVAISAFDKKCIPLTIYRRARK